MKKTRINLLLGIMAVIIASVFTEAVLFNLDYITLPAEEKGIHEVEIDELILNDMAVQGESLVVTGDEPSFQFDEDMEILDLKITPDPSSLPFSMTAVESKLYVYPPKRYDYHPDYKPALYLEIHEPTPEVIFQIQEPEQPGTVSITQMTVDNSFSINPLRLFVILLLMSLLFYFIWFRDFVGRNLHVTFLLVSVGIGLIVLFSTPLNFSFDEKEHFVKAYQISSFDLGLEKEQPIPWIDEIDEFLKYDGSTSAFNTYKEKMAYMEEFSESDYEETKYIHSTASTYLPTAYIPASVGLLLGRILQLPFYMVFYLGRIFGLVGYSLVLFFTIKKVKMAKRLIFAIGLLPALLYVVSSYTADSMTVAFSLAAVGVYLNMRGAKVKSLDYKLPTLFAACCAIVVMSKLPYAPLCLLILAVPKDRFKAGTNHLLVKLATIAATGIFAVGAMFYSLSYGLNQWGVPGVSSKGQVLFILQNIPEYAMIVWRFISTEFYSFFLSPIGNLAYSGTMSSIIVYTLLIYLFILAVTDNVNDEVTLGVWDRIWLFLAITLSWALVITSLYMGFNPVGSTTILGVQGRYFTPLILPLLLILRGRSIKNGLNEENFNYFISIFSTSFALFMALKIFMLYNI